VWGAECVTTEGEACDQTRCDGTVLEMCNDEDVVEGRMDCADLGPTYLCIYDGAYNAECRSVDTLACSGSESICVGPMAHICYAGAWQVLDCSEFASAGCTMSGGDAHCESSAWEETLAGLGTVGTSPTPRTGTDTYVACLTYVANVDACLVDFAAANGIEPATSEPDFCDSFSVDSVSTTDYFECLSSIYVYTDCAEALPDPDLMESLCSLQGGV